MWSQCKLAAKESGLECACVNNDDFTALVSGGSRLCWVSLCTVWPSHSKWLSRAKIYIKFSVKPEHSSMETIQMIQEAATMDNWWLAASSRQCAHSCITARADFLGETSNHPGHSAPYSPDLVPCNFWLFPKLKSPLKRKRFQTTDEIKENDRAADGD